MSEFIDGKNISHTIAEELHTFVQEHTLSPKLDIIIVGDNKVTESFVRTKKKFAEKIGVAFIEHRFSEDATEALVIDTIHACATSGTDGIVVQLPLPVHIDTNRVLAHIPREFDVDLLTDDAYNAFVRGEDKREPPVAGAVHEILNRSGVAIEGAKTVVVGKGRLVGEPTAAVLRLNGAADVFTVDRDTPRAKRDAKLKEADIVVSGAGVPNLITPDLVREGVVLIDAGTSNAGRTIVGDISLECAPKAKVFSKTPGGVGPVTVAVLYRNAIVHAEQQRA